MRVLWSIGGVLLALVLIGWIGLLVQPRPFASPNLEEGPAEMVPVPEGLPAPVERFIRTIYGEEVPLYHSVVMSGRARIRPAGPFHFPARFRFIHETGTNYRHYIEMTWFGIPIMAVNEGIVDGASFFENALLGNQYDNPKSNQGATLALWAEAIWFPAVLVTDDRVRWESVDADTALLRVPFEDGEETFVVRFDPETGLQTTMEVMRYQGSDDAARKTLWIPSSDRWDTVSGHLTAASASATWFFQRTSWAYFDLEEMLFNADVAGYLRARGQ